MSYTDVKNFRQRLKERTVYVMGGKCQCCGYDKCIQALELHHLDPSQKDFSFNENPNRSWSSTRAEIKKCILVCANCHREIHAGLIENEKLKSSFNEELAQEIDILVEQVKHKQIYYCKFCGTEVSRGNDTCPKCANKQKRVVERPSREELKTLLREKTFVSIGQQFGVSDNAIRKWCDSYNLPRKMTEIKKFSDKEWEKI